MNKFSLYSKPTALIIRIYCLCVIGILLYTIIGALLFREISGEILISFIINSFIIIITGILFFNPSKIEIISFSAFLNSIFIIPNEPNNVMGVFMYVLAFTSLYARGYYKNNKRIKIILTILGVLGLLSFQIKFGIEIFYVSFIVNIGHLFVMLCILYFVIQGVNVQNQKTEKKLNIAFYPDLTKRDCQWLGKIQQNVKYGAIAIEDHLSVGTVKNRLKKIYDALEVGDKSGFLNKYEDYKIYFDMTEEKEVK